MKLWDTLLQEETRISGALVAISLLSLISYGNCRIISRYKMDTLSASLSELNAAILKIPTNKSSQLITNFQTKNAVDD